MKKLLFIFILLTWACTSRTQNVLIENVNVVDVRNGDILAGRHVEVKDGLIISVSSMAPADFNGNRVNGEGMYLMPGLAEMHAHIPSPDWGRKDAETTLFLYLANGVTTIRGMLGHPVHLELREASRKGNLMSPRIFTSSPSLNGNTVPTAEEAMKKVKAYSDAGYDFLKIHPGIKREVFDVLVQTARSEGIPFAGHVPIDVGIRHALESGYASVDHVDGFVEGLVPSTANVAPDANGFFGYNFTYLADEESIPELVDLSKKHNVWIVPTQSLFDRWFSPNSAASYMKESEMKYMPASILKAWETNKNDLVADPSYNVDQWEAFNALRRKLIYQLQKNGQGLLLGSDAPQVLNVPGFSIHHEMQGMLDAGLTPLEIIQSGTMNPARYFDMEGEFGVISEGAAADMILIDSNPLEDLTAIRSPAAVFYRGKMITRTQINEILQSIAEEAIDE